MLTATHLGRYAELTGGNPTPGPDPWPAAVARIAGLVPAGLGDAESGGSRPHPRGRPPGPLHCRHPAGELTIGAPGHAAPSPGWKGSRPGLLSPWHARLAALGRHDLAAGISEPVIWPASGDDPADLVLVSGADVRAALGAAPERNARRLGDPVAAAWLVLRRDQTPPGYWTRPLPYDTTGEVIINPSAKFGPVLTDAVWPTITCLRMAGADVGAPGIDAWPGSIA